MYPKYLPTYAPHSIFAQHCLSARIRAGTPKDRLSCLGKGTSLQHVVLLCTACCSRRRNWSSITSTKSRGSPSVSSGTGASINSTGPQVLCGYRLVLLLFWSGGVLSPVSPASSWSHTTCKEVIATVWTWRACTVSHRIIWPIRGSYDLLGWWGGAISLTNWPIELCAAQASCGDVCNVRNWSMMHMFLFLISYHYY